MEIDAITLLCGIIAFASSCLVVVFSYVTSIMKKILNSIDSLNIKMAVMVNEVAHHDKRISKMENMSLWQEK